MSDKQYHPHYLHSVRWCCSHYNLSAPITLEGGGINNHLRGLILTTRPIPNTGLPILMVHERLKALRWRFLRIRQNPIVRFTCEIGTRMRINENFNPDSLDFVLYLDGNVRASDEWRRGRSMWSGGSCCVYR